MRIRSVLNAALLSCSLLFVHASHAADAETINLNTATAQEIARVLVGVGEAKAQAIVEYREANGGFEDIYELEHVKGIGERTVAQNEARIRLK
jgi:competence protein ComEA